MNIPVIDISSLVNQSANSKELNKTINEITNACQNEGFFLIKNHGVPNVIIDNLSKDTCDFFDLPLHLKNKFFSEDQIKYPYGYMGIGYENLNASHDLHTKVLPDLKESFSIGNKLLETKWPSKPLRFEESWIKYYQNMVIIANKLLEVFALGLDLNKNYFNKFTNNHASALRVLNYPEIKGYKTPKNQVRASPHTDYGTITILKTDGPGLQIYKDEKWIDVPVIENTFIVNIGDMMQRWTNDKWCSTIHQVIKYGENKRRQSIAFFHNPNNDALIEPIVKDEEAKYNPIKSKDFLMKKHLATIKR